MRILFLSQAWKVEDQPDYDVSFRRAKSEGRDVELLNIPFRGYVQNNGCDAFYREVVKANTEFKPDLVFFQFFHSAGLCDPTECVNAVRASSHRPLVFGSLGDLFDTGFLQFLARPIPKHTLQLAAATDAFFSTSMGNIAESLLKNGAKNVIFLPNAFCPMHFPDWDLDSSEPREYGIAMLCSNVKLLSRFPVRAFNNTYRRRSTVKCLMRHFGKNFSVFGRGWAGVSSRGAIPFKEQVNIYRKSRVVVDAPAPIIKTTYYSSDRAFFMLGSGTPLVHFHTPRFEKMLRPEEHAYYVESEGEAVKACRRLLKMTDEELKDHRRKIVAFVKERHLIDHRIDTIISVAEAIKKVREGMVAPDAALGQIRMWHFLPEVDMQEEFRYAVANWVG